MESGGGGGGGGGGAQGRRESLSLAQAVTHLLDECRMVLPGIQALFGFQLIAVFSSRFAAALTPPEQRLHLAAIGLVALAVALVMTPAAWHRQMGLQEVSAEFMTVGTRLLLWSMFPLMVAIAIDFYLIARVILDNSALSLALALLLLGCFCVLWFLLPRRRRRR